MSNTSITRASALAGAVVLAAGLSACGSSSSSGSASSSTTEKKVPSSGEVYKQVRAAAMAAKSGHVKGTVSQSGDTMTLDMGGVADGSNGKTVISTKDGKITVVMAGAKAYVGGDAKFWTSSAGAAEGAKLVGKYVELPAAQAKEFTSGLSLKGLLDEMFSDPQLSKMQNLTTKVTETTLDGQAAYLLEDRVAKDGQIYVSADGKGQLLKIVGTKDQPGSLEFSEWDAYPAVAAPAANLIVRKG